MSKGTEPNRNTLNNIDHLTLSQIFDEMCQVVSLFYTGMHGIKPYVRNNGTKL